MPQINWNDKAQVDAFMRALKWVDSKPEFEILSAAQLALEAIKRCEPTFPVDEESFKTVLTKAVNLHDLLQLYAEAGDFAIFVNDGTLTAVSILGRIKV